MADTTVSLFPQFMAQVGGAGGGVETVIVGGLGIEMEGNLAVEIQMEIETADVSEVLVPVDASFLTVTVVEQHDVGIDVCG